MEHPRDKTTGSVSRQWVGFLAAMVGVSAMLGINAYLLGFGTYREFDDEGLFLQGVRLALNGTVLYDELIVPFGPTYYIESAIVHGLLGVPATTDGIRWHLLSLWGVTSGVAAAIVYLLTGRVTIALAGQLAVFYCLRSMTNEPGHPQQLVALLLMVIVATGLLWERRQVLATALLGAGAAALLLVKVNSGAFAIGAIGVTAAIVWRRHPLLRLFVVPILGVAILLPWVLMRERLEIESVFRLALLISVSLAIAVNTGIHLKPAGSSWRRLAALPLGFLVTAAAVIGWTVARGSTPAAMWQSLVVLPSQHTGTYHLPMPILPVSILGAGASATMALWVARGLRDPDGASAAASSAACGWLQTIYGAALLLMAVGISDVVWLHIILLQIALPWCWLVLVAAQTHQTSARAGFARMLICFLTLMHSLYVYPVAGSQKAFSVVLLIPLAAICLHDGLRILALNSSPMRRRGLDVVPIAVGIACLALSLRHLDAARASFASQVPLGLPGAERLRMPEQKAAEYRKLVSLLRKFGDTFLCSDGWNSLYFWTGIAPPSHMIVFHDLGDDEMHWYPAAQKRQTLDRFWASPRPIYLRTRERDSDFFRELDRKTVSWTRVGRAELRRPADSRGQAADPPE